MMRSLTSIFLEGFKGYSINLGSDNVRGTGIGAELAAFDDLYEPTNDAWLLATITYDVTGKGETDLFLQIGEHGMVNAGEESKDQWVVFGDPNDPPLRAGPGYDVDVFGRGRLADSATPDAMISVLDSAPALAASAIPEPSTLILVMFAVAVACGCGPPRRRLHSQSRREGN